MGLRDKRVWVGAFVVAALLAFGLVGFAQQGPGGMPPHGHGGPGGPEGHGGPGGGLFGPLGRELNLTDAQKAQVKQIEDSFRDSTKSLSEKMRALHESEMATLASGTFDEAAVRAAAQERAAVQVELDVAHAKMMSQIIAVLTPEQKAKLAELHKQMEQRGREPESRRGGEGGERP
jgi:Spy/CpxP family protein refolding chaperone